MDLNIKHTIALNSFSGKISKDRKRVGRGIGSGKGRTCGAGNKGQSSRSGVTMKRRHAEFVRRFPKIGFTSRTIKPLAITLRDLEVRLNKTNFDLKKKIDNDTLVELGFDTRNGVKLIGNEASLPIKISILSASKGAAEAIKSAGGSVETVN
jgi:large subunit ribosomal protein L15